jgi:hypothetical protein
MDNNLLNGFNDGLHRSSGVGGELFDYSIDLTQRKIIEAIEHEPSLENEFYMENKTSTTYENGNDTNRLLASVASQKVDLIKEYLEPTGITLTELMDRNAFASLCQLLDAYLLEAVRNSR